MKVGPMKVLHILTKCMTTYYTFILLYSSHVRYFESFSTIYLYYSSYLCNSLFRLSPPSFSGN